VIRFEVAPKMVGPFRIFASALAFVLVAASSAAQQSGVPENTKSDRRELTNEQKDWHFDGHVEIDLGNDSSLFADDVRFKTEGDSALATGNVVFAQGTNRITAERAEFNTETRLGTFYNAWGVATVQPPRQAARAGVFAPPPMTGQDTFVYFFGESIEKIGPKKYKITKGGFTTCVQPTPRWNLEADTMILNVDHYTILRDAVFTVKGVPMFYLPILYYPTKRDGRATGILIPTYGSSSLRGHSIHNAFFWAMGRSHDATFMHDWFSKTGQGVGGEYRYNLGLGNDGNFRTYLLDQHDTTYLQPNGTSLAYPGSRSYEVRGGANQALPGNLRARGRVDYFSSIVTSQTFNTNIYDASRNSRTFGGNVVGAWGTYTLNGTLDHSEYFYDLENSRLAGSWPRVNIARNERPLFGSQVYFSVGSEFAHFLRSTRTPTGEDDSSLTRFDVVPQIRYPFKKWQWLTANSTVSWRDTYYTRSLSPNNVLVEDNLNRRLYSLQTQIVGPVFNRIWDTPGSGYAEKFKHTVEPFLSIQRTSSVDNFRRIVQFDGVDTYLGGTQYSYGLNNRFYAKRVLNPGSPAQAREIIDVELTQTYYTNQSASLFDRQYQTNGLAAATHFSPLALNVRAMPTNDVNATVRAEFDSRYKELRGISAQGTYSWSNLVQASAGWSKKAFIKDLAGFNDPRYLDHFINSSTTVHTADNRLGSIYTLYYDVLRSTLLQQKVSAFYNAQCCGLAIEYQTYNRGAGSSLPIPSDHRFFLSFTLAGLGNFSPFNGALSGVPR
jgi:LPS-assembly protein